MYLPVVELWVNHFLNCYNKYVPRWFFFLLDAFYHKKQNRLKVFQSVKVNGMGLTTSLAISSGVLVPGPNSFYAHATGTQ